MTRLTRPGNMAIAMSLLVASRPHPPNLRVTAQVLFYSVTDCASESTTFKTFSQGPHLLPQTLRWMIQAFLPNALPGWTFRRRKVSCLGRNYRQRQWKRLFSVLWEKYTISRC